MKTKKCTKCKEDKFLSDYNKNKTRKDGLNNICRICSNNQSKEYYHDNSKKHKETVKERNKKKILENRQLLRDYLNVHPCIVCGEPDPIVLEFDHRDDAVKKYVVSVMVGVGYSWKTIMKEIDKCDVRCANCHRRRTAEQQGWYKDIK